MAEVPDSMATSFSDTTSMTPSTDSSSACPSPQSTNMTQSTSSSGSGTSPQLPLYNKLLDQVVRTPGRPSTQPTHLGVPATSHANNSRILHETGPGYLAPKFEGKEKQLEHGEQTECGIFPRGSVPSLIDHLSSHRYCRGERLSTSRICCFRDRLVLQLSEHRRYIFSDRDGRSDCKQHPVPVRGQGGGICPR